MTSRSYWLDLFSGTTWKEFLDAGGKVSGFRESRRKTVQKMRGVTTCCVIFEIPMMLLSTRNYREMDLRNELRELENRN